MSGIAAIGASKFAADTNAGKQLSRDEAIRLALGNSVPPAPAAEGRVGALSILGKREADVARLVAEGLTNKQIGTRLFISERTVDTHVRSILNKLGVNSRSQIAGWVASFNH